MSFVGLYDGKFVCAIFIWGFGFAFWMVILLVVGVVLLCATCFGFCTLLLHAFVLVGLGLWVGFYWFSALGCGSRMRFLYLPYGFCVKNRFL